MFKIENLSSKALLSVIVSHNNVELEFIIGSVISKRNKDELEGDVQFRLLNAYLDYKGPDFKDELMSKYIEADEIILKSLTNKYIHPLPYGIVHPILDMFDMLDVFNYIKNIYRIVPPSILSDSFDPIEEKDHRKTRVQTYIKDDYLELAAFAMIVKSGMITVCHFGHVKNNEINSNHMEYNLFHFFRAHRIFETAPMVKLLGLVDKVVNVPTNGADISSIRVLEKMVPKSEMPVYILAIVVLQRVSIATIVDDVADKNLVLKIYNYINNKLKDTGEVSKSIRDKKPLMDGDGSGSGDKESIIESFRKLTNLTKGDEVEMDWVISSVEMILKQMPAVNKQYIDEIVLKDAIHFTKEFRNGNLTRAHIDIISIIFKNVIDPRCIDYVSLESIMNLIAIGFAYLWGLGFKQLALLLSAQPDNTERIRHTINSSVNRPKMTKEIKEALDFHFPYKRVINDTTSVNLVEEYVNELANEMFKIDWVSNAYTSYLVDVFGAENNQELLPADLKMQLAEFIIKNEELNNAV